MKKVIILGASSGIGRALAKVLADRGCHLGLAARRLDLLAELKAELPSPAIIKRVDLSVPDEAIRLLHELVTEMNGVDLFVISAGVGFVNRSLDWDKERTTAQVNVLGFTAAANVAANLLQQQGTGHLVGLSSIASVRGAGDAPAYSASKAYMSNYLEGLRHKFAKLKLPITVTDIQLGFVDTAMAKAPNRFWVASPEKAAKQIADAIDRRATVAYVTKRWRLISWLARILPERIYFKL